MEPAQRSYPLWNIFHTLFIPGWGTYLCSFLLHSLMGYLLIELNNIYAIIRMRASIQTAAYLLFVAVCPALYPITAGTVASLALLTALFFLFRSYQKGTSSSDLFYTFLCIGTGSLAFPQLTYFVPVFWAGAYLFQSLHPKSFFASILGWWLPFWLLLAHAYFHGQVELFLYPFAELAAFSSVNFRFQPWETATLSYLLLLFIVSGTHCLIAGYEDKIRTRSYLQFIIFYTCYTFLYIVLQPAMCVFLLPALLIGISILAGHLFVLTNQRSSNYFFIFMLISLCILFCYNVWTLL